LDPNSVIELLKYCEEEFSESRYEREVQYHKPEDSNIQEYCREHPEELLGYFCFECETECICAECAIHGNHKGHEVLQIKKAYPVIKDKVEEIFLYINNKIDEVELRAEKIENQKKEIIDQGNSAKQQVLISFEDLKARIERKEREIIGQIDRGIEDNLKEAENYSRIVSGKITALESISETLKKILMSASQADLLDYYAENKQKTYNSIENELSTLSNIDKSTSLRCVVSPNSLAEHIESIKAVQIQISALKYTEDTGERKLLERTKRLGPRNS
jgi:B-box zinc finger